MDQEFEQFWQQYPRREGKLAAKKAYTKARTMATAQEILDGVERYREHKPSYQDFCHPTTFLNQGRWMDEYPNTAKSYDWRCPHDPHCKHRAECQVISMRKQA